MRYFDYERVAREAGLGPEDLDRIHRVIRAEFPTDDMLYELHMLRAVKAVRDGRVTVQGIVDSANRAPEPHVCQSA